ncbi:MAG: hypothetical protein NTW75_02245, partial [Planctomycetales bacterium]|nr:hypothetical protein [Planctomycetales bacterium]
MRDLANRFLTSTNVRLHTDDLSQTMFSDYFGICERILHEFGRNRLAARGERQLLEFESAMDRQLRRVWVSVVSNELFAVETAEMLERRTN